MDRERGGSTPVSSPGPTRGAALQDDSSSAAAVALRLSTESYILDDLGWRQTANEERVVGTLAAATRGRELSGLLVFVVAMVY